MLVENKVNEKTLKCVANMEAVVVNSDIPDFALVEFRNDFITKYNYARLRGVENKDNFIEYMDTYEINAYYRLLVKLLYQNLKIDLPSELLHYYGVLKNYCRPESTDFEIRNKASYYLSDFNLIKKRIAEFTDLNKVVNFEYILRDLDDVATTPLSRIVIDNEVSYDCGFKPIWMFLRYYGNALLLILQQEKYWQQENYKALLRAIEQMQISLNWE